MSELSAKFSDSFVREFISEWKDICYKLKNSGYDLRKIVIAKKKQRKERYYGDTSINYR